MVWLPPGAARVYGTVVTALRDAFGVDPPGDRLPLLLHPQAPAPHRRLAATHGQEPLRDVQATPTASYRSVVAWRPDHPPTILKLSIGAVVARTRRSLAEEEIARAVLVDAVFDTIPPAHCEELGLDWFTELGGVVETASCHGWLLRRPPRTVSAVSGAWLMPMFSLVSKRGDHPPLLVELVRRAGHAPTDFVIETLVRPYVTALSYLLFVQGIQPDAHSQNLLWEMDGDRGPSGRLVLRDFSDTSVSIPLRIARRKRLPMPPLPTGGVAFPLASAAADYTYQSDRPVVYRAAEVVELHGLRGFLWVLNTSLSRYFTQHEYDATQVEDAYLRLWQDSADRFLGVHPLRRTGRPGVATDGALTYYLRHQDWAGLGATSGHTLPNGVERCRPIGGANRRGGPVYQRLESAWGDLFLLDGLPSYFRPAF